MGPLLILLVVDQSRTPPCAWGRRCEVSQRRLLTVRFYQHKAASLPRKCRVWLTAMIDHDACVSGWRDSTVVRSEMTSGGQGRDVQSGDDTLPRAEHQ